MPLSKDGDCNIVFPGEYMMSETMVMIHGMWGGEWCWENFKGFFEGKGYHCITPVLRFHDVDPEEPPHPKLGTTSLLDYAEDLEKEINELEEMKGDDYPLIDVAKWELTKALIETVLHEQGVVDERMGITKLGEQLSIPFRLSFNTLLMNKIIKQK